MPRHGRLARRAIGAALALLLLCAPAAGAIPGDEIPLSATRPAGQGGADAAGELTAFGGEGKPAAAPAPAAARRPTTVKKCSTRKHVRTCRTYRGTRIVKTCLKKPHHKEKCATPRKKGKKVPPQARAATRVTSGYESPIGPAIGRSYYHDAENTVQYGGWCSGAFIGWGLFLTAAHCLYDNGGDGGTPHAYPAKEMTVVPGNTIDKAGKPYSDYGTWLVGQNFVPQGWIDGDKGMDWGIQVIPPTAKGVWPGQMTGTFTAYAGVALAPGADVEAFGYPASFLFASPQYYYGAGQYFATSTFNGSGWWDFGSAANGLSSGTWVYFESEMTGGSSGGPVFTKFADGRYGIFGVVNRGRPNQAGTSDYQLTVMFDDRFLDFYHGVLNAVSGAPQAPGAARPTTAVVSG